MHNSGSKYPTKVMIYKNGVCAHLLSRHSVRYSPINFYFCTISCRHFMFKYASVIFSVLFCFLMNSGQMYAAQDTVPIPTILIETGSQSISGEVIPATFTLLEEGYPSIREHSIGIRWRGASSLGYPKKSLKIEFWTDSTGAETQNISLLGMRSDDDWNLNAMYNEPLRFNSVSAYTVWNKLHTNQSYLSSKGKNGIDIQYVQLFINYEYQGIYILTERVDRKQLDLNTETGELYKSKEHSAAAGFRKAAPYDNNKNIWEGIHLKHPEDKIDWRNLYDFVDFVVSSTDRDFYSYYQDYIYLNNFVDYFLFINLLALWDNTDKNIYLAKNNKFSPYYYIPWDLDGSFGFSWDGTFTTGINGILDNGLYKRLLKDCYPDGFVERTRVKWDLIRNDFVHTDSLLTILYNNFIHLYQNDIYNKEALVWTKYEFKPSYLNEIRNWLDERIEYLDIFFKNLCSGSTGTENQLTSYTLKVYPNPAKYIITIELNEQASKTESMFELFNLKGQKIIHGSFTSETKVDLNNLSSGMYILKVIHKDFIQTERIIVL